MVRFFKRLRDNVSGHVFFLNFFFFFSHIKVTGPGFEPEILSLSLVWFLVGINVSLYDVTFEIFHVFHCFKFDLPEKNYD